NSTDLNVEFCLENFCGTSIAQGASRGRSTWTTNYFLTMTTGMYKSRANKHTLRTRSGFSTIELLITATILTIVTAFGVMGITRTKASIRLSGAAREYASYIEKARTLSIRNHADDASERATVTINDDKTSYTVTMDLDGDGDMDTRTIPLP